MTQTPSQQSSVKHAQISDRGQRESDQSLLELSFVDLICHLENMLATARESDRGSQVEYSAKAAEKMLNKLLEFNEAYLTKEAYDESLTEILKASDKGVIHQQMIDNRPWKTAFICLFIDTVDAPSKATHIDLGKAIACACATVFCNALELLDGESPMSQQIRQSTEVFVREFSEAW